MGWQSSSLQFWECTGSKTPYPLTIASSTHLPAIFLSSSSGSIVTSTPILKVSEYYELK